MQIFETETWIRISQNPVAGIRDQISRGINKWQDSQGEKRKLYIDGLEILPD